MYKEIWATFFHLCSTDKNPNHGNCPAGAESWCTYRRAEAQGLDMSIFQHNYRPLDPQVEEALKPIYTDLSRRDLLDRCKGRNTQNNNESYNALLWHFAPKHLHNGLKTIELANFLAVGIFNDGFQSILKILQIMKVIIGPIAKEYADKRDRNRIYRAQLRHQAASKESRAARRKATAAQQVLFEEVGSLYGYGIAD
ncbi:uncharacterized protein LOC122400403 [Colletes gigas]|uniref:uncharacterized protein LOC122400403 n=1 Tax=Colletes gigas TaxID=935657 RepID=UPI001C9A8672|nr:uncharacterized protein LOC122400403 [Colletes gigas]